MARKQKLLPHVAANPSSDAIADKARGARSAHPPPALATEKAPTSFRNMSPRPRAVPSGSATSPPEEPPSQISRSNRSARDVAVRALHQQAWSEAGDCSPPKDVPPNRASLSGRRDLSGA
jgi:hypothetical protein